ncbi:hypothetical protein BJ993_002201 [Nocardioides aromaticivorans]|uniref:Uncharacterized protein n=1 Tax=Nocardioides aromaticivorans TaxID=200618 RepID=A0A7Z0CKU8_9ACTN|nr:hypothetical protein [Nocardioides aromaticivorans]NYI45121.1 hypothetical protein [Nocardioides aromaticivorans]
MPTARSSPAEPTPHRRARAHPVRDVGHLLRFRAATVRRPRAAALALAVLGLATVAAAVVPAWVTVDPGLARLLQPGLVAIALVAGGSAAASGGGRELLPRDAAAVHPISPLTDHLGALLLSPLSAGWLIQAWALLGLASAVGVPAAPVVALCWLVASTVLAQAVGWTSEWLRRRHRGLLPVRLALPLVVAGLLAAGPAEVVAATIRDGDLIVVVVVTLVVVTLGLVVLGARLAGAVARLVPRDEGRLETRAHAPRPTPRSDFVVLRRIDRGSVWRSAPLRRGTWLLALAPGSVALAGGLDWPALVLMPGLVASGCVLLFGVNLWCLDGRGMLWRETLPVAPRTVVAARAWVLAELLLGAGAVTLLLGAVRAGRPTAAELAAVVLALAVVVAQSVSAGLRWSAAHPHAVDLRSARATPAPPLAMVGYSLRLAVATTVAGLLLTGLATAGRVDLLLAVAAVLVLVSALRISRSVRRWADPLARAEVVAVVAA